MCQLSIITFVHSTRAKWHLCIHPFAVSVNDQVEIKLEATVAGCSRAASPSTPTCVLLRAGPQVASRNTMDISTIPTPAPTTPAPPAQQPTAHRMHDLKDLQLPDCARFLHVEGVLPRHTLSNVDLERVPKCEANDLLVKTAADGTRTLVHDRSRHANVLQAEGEAQLRAFGLHDVVCHLAVAHARLAGVKLKRVRASFCVIRGTMCPKWHVGNLVLRGIITLHGPGTVVWDAGADAEFHVEAGSLVFLRGQAASCGHGGDVAAVHRSPKIPENEVRVIIRTDHA